MSLWSLEGKSILVVDDYAEMRSMLRHMLHSFGADNISSVSTGEDAIKKIAETAFDIILCDYNLGDGKDGQEVLEEIKFRDLLPYSSIFIMVTAEISSLKVMGALEHQPDEYLSKPVNRSLMQARIHKVEEKKRKLGALADALAVKNYTQAIALCQYHIDNGAKNRQELLKLQCDLLIQERMLDQATDVCQSVLQDRPIQWAMFALGKVHFQRQEYTEAKAQFTSVIQTNEAFVGAYDWLAESYRQTNDPSTAQSTLETALQWSSKSVTRLRSLAEVAEENGDLKTAEMAWEKTVKTGKNSIQSRPTDFTQLAKAQLSNGKNKEALKTVERLKFSASSNPEGKVIAAIALEGIQKNLGNTTAAEAAAQDAFLLYKKCENSVSHDVALETASSCLARGAIAEAADIVNAVAHNFHDNPNVLSKINKLYETAGIEHNSADMIAEIKQQMITINKQGVTLLEAGDFRASAGVFEKALDLAPQNTFLNVNTAHAHIMLMRQSGLTEESLTTSRHCLDLVKSDTKLGERYRMLDQAYWGLVNKQSSRNV